MVVWSVSLLLLITSKYVQHLTFIVWALGVTFLQLNSDPRDTGLLHLLYARLSNSKAAVRRLNLILHLSDANLRPGTAWKSDHGGPNYGDKFQGDGERVDSYPALSDTNLNPDIFWKSPGGHSLNSAVYKGNRETGLNVVADCTTFYTSTVDKRGSWRCT